MNTQYIFQQGTTTVVFAYDLNGLLIEVHITSDDVKRSHQWLQANLYFEEKYMKQTIENSYQLQQLVSVLPADLHFEIFWNHYNYKKGKVAAQAAYKKLNDTEKASCMLGVKKYQKSVQKDGTAIVYAERYIKRRYWEDEWE